MAILYSVLGFLPVQTNSDPASFDMISALPLEMALAILRLLPGKYLLNAACTSSRWFWLCRSDNQLRSTIRRHLRRLARQRMRAVITDNIGIGRRRTSFNEMVQERPLAIDGVQEEYRFKRNHITAGSTALHNVRGSVSRIHRYSPYRRKSVKLGNPRAEPESGRRKVLRM